MRYSFLTLTIIIAVFTAGYLLLTGVSKASTMSDDNYIIDLNPEVTASPQTHLQDVKGTSDVRQGVINGDGFTVEQGFDYIFGLNDFVFSLSPLIIDYGPFSPTNPVTRLQNLSVNVGSAFSYSVSVVEDHELILQNGNTISIPSTTCDDGLCSKEFASGWSNPLTFGFGYSCKALTGNDCVIKKSGGFMEFPNQIDSDNVENIMDGTGSDKIKKSEIIYKVNTATTQSKGLYSNTITYIAVPGY